MIFYMDVARASFHPHYKGLKQDEVFIVAMTSGTVIHTVRSNANVTY